MRLVLCVQGLRRCLYDGPQCCVLPLPRRLIVNTNRLLIVEKLESPGRSAVVEPSAKLQSTVWLDPTCDVRCLACIGVVVFHIAYYVAHAAEDKHAINSALAQHLWFIFLFNPEPAMQAFMCLTGYVVSTVQILRNSVHVLFCRCCTDNPEAVVSSQVFGSCVSCASSGIHPKLHPDSAEVRNLLCRPRWAAHKRCHLLSIHRVHFWLLNI